METLTDFRTRLMERYEISQASYYNKLNELKELSYNIESFQKGGVKGYSPYQKALITAFIAHRESGAKSQDFTFVPEDEFKEEAVEQEALPLPVPLPPTVNEGWGDGSSSIQLENGYGYQYNPETSVPVLQNPEYFNDRVLERRVAQEILAEEALRASENFTDPQLIREINQTRELIAQHRLGKLSIAKNVEGILKGNSSINPQ